jgi:hypothetical protein
MFIKAILVTNTLLTKFVIKSFLFEKKTFLLKVGCVFLIRNLLRIEQNELSSIFNKSDDRTRLDQSSLLPWAGDVKITTL